MRTERSKFHIMVLSMTFTMIGLWPTLGTAQCLVEDAANAAYQEQLKAIGTATPDVESIFSGPASCVNTDLLDQFDLSNLIPDPLGLVTDAVTDAVTNAIQNAKQQVCQAINEKVTGTINDVQGTITDHRGTLSVELQNVLQNGWSNG